MHQHRSKIGRRYDWIPDLPDPRDLVMTVSRKVALPAKVDLSPKCSPVEDQGELGSCTANALAGALEFLEDVDGVPFQDISRLFIYYNERALEGTIGQDAGAMIRDGVKSLNQTGVCSEDLWPYVIGKFKTRPSAAAFNDAAGRKITVYKRVPSLTAAKASLAGGRPVVFGFTVFDAFESDAVAKTGKLNLPKPTEQNLGGHAVLMVGYDDKTQRVKVRNSWGKGWGLNGYFTMPYAYVSDPKLADDFWAISAGTKL